MMKFGALTLYLLARITVTLISSSVIIGCFQKVNFQVFNLEHVYMRPEVNSTRFEV